MPEHAPWMCRKGAAVVGAALAFAGCEALSSDRMVEARAEVVANGPYDFGTGAAREHGLAIRYLECPDVAVAFRLPPEGTRSGSCLETLELGARVEVVLRASENRLSGHKSWYERKIGGCPIDALDGITEITGPGRCAWMKDPH